MAVVSVGLRRAVGYRRVSSPKQAGVRRVSLETQDARINGFCSSDGSSIVANFLDVETGRKDDRRDYQRMVRYVLDGNADVVVVQFLDRFGRNPREILRRVWELQEAGVEVVATDEDIREELILLVKAGVAGQETRRIGERTRATMTTAAKKGQHFGRAPFGFRRVRVGDEVTYEHDELEAAAVREMVRLIVEENLGYKRVADRLAAGGFVARAGAWSADTVRVIVGNAALVGTLLFNRRPRKGNEQGEIVRIEGYFPPLLEAAEWQALQDRLAIRRENPRGRAHASDYLLSGIARCGHCGGPMVGKRSYQRKDRHGNYRRYANYWCSQAQRSRERCAFYNGHAATKLEATILEHLGQYADPERVRELWAERPRGAVAEAESELKRVERRLADIDRDFLDNLSLLKRGVLDEQDFARANAARKDERTGLASRHDQLVAQQRAARSQDAVIETLPTRVQSFLEDFPTLETRRAKAILQGILSAAHVYRDGRIELEFRTA